MGVKIKSKYAKPRILFMGEEVALSHIVRPLVLAESVKDTYEVFFAAGKRYAKLIEDSGINYHKIWTLSADTFVERLVRGQDGWFAEDFSNEVKADIGVIEEIQPDLVIADLRWSLGVSATVAKVPYLSLLNAHWSPYYSLTCPPPELPIVKILGVKLSEIMTPVIGHFVLKHLAKPFNIVRQEYGLERVKSYQHIGVCADWVVYLDIPSLGPTKNIPPSYCYIGPVQWMPEVLYPDWWDRIPRNKPVAYVSMGSTGKIDYIYKLVETLSEIGMAVLLATSGRFEQKDFGNTIYTAEYLPGLEACRKSHLVVCNGGTGAIYQAIMAEVPILGIPTNGDQYFTMGSVQEQGAGLFIRSTHVNSKRVKRAVSKLLSESGFKFSCSKLKAEMAQYDAVVRFKEFLASLWY